MFVASARTGATAMNERQVALNLSLSSSGRRDASSPGGDAGAECDEDARHRFEAALRAEEASEQPAALPPSSPAPASLLRHDLDAGSPPRRDLALLRAALAGLFVGDRRDGRRQTAMQIADDLLPGVLVTVYEAGGAWVADFVCSDDDSRQLLCAQAGSQVREMARRCARPVGWRVMAADERDPRLREFWAEPDEGAP